MESPNIIVVGDVMLDHSIYVAPDKIANEAPIIAYAIRDEEYVLGGSGNVLDNLHRLGCGKLFLFGACGSDRNAAILKEKLAATGAEAHLLEVPGSITTTKTRYFCENKILFRADQEKRTEQNAETTLQILTKIQEILKKGKIHCIVLSDYNKGYLSAAVAQGILELARAHGIFTVVDPKEDYHKYVGCSLIKPNRKEALRLFGCAAAAPLSEIHTKILSAVGCKYSVVTLAEEGLTLFDGTTLIHERTEQRAILDVTGAGDIVCTVLAYLFSRGVPPALIAKLATYIATKSVAFPGTYKVSTGDLDEAFLHCAGKLIQPEQIPRHGKTVVFTNGCFDVLHRGHVELFKYCRSLGDIVVVGLNSDASIRRLKGAARPIHTLEDRIAVLEGISYIDYIIPFEEDTPWELLGKIRPTVLVKGSDYTLESVVGREFAEKTVLFQLLPGKSSTAILQKSKF